MRRLNVTNDVDGRALLAAGHVSGVPWRTTVKNEINIKGKFKTRPHKR